jgi:ArsR family transcriptional regulator, arsenate/arsenite/antimonite-responsive transcriptional repressor
MSRHASAIISELQVRGRRAGAPRSRSPSALGADVSQMNVRPLARILRALGDETRLRIVAWLAHGELCVCHLEKALGLSQPNVSRQLGVLRAAGVVDNRRDGTWVYYSLVVQDHPAAAAMLDSLVKSFGEVRALRAEHLQLRKSCGPPVGVPRIER